MEIHFLKEDALAALKANIKGNVKHYSEPTNQWIYDYFDGENPFSVLKVPVEDFQLVGSEEDCAQRDVENAIILYSALKILSDTQATDERIWAGLAHAELWEYMQKRWRISGEKYFTESQIEGRFFYKKGNGFKRSMFVQTLSKMWWTVRLTYAPDQKDPYAYTRYFTQQYSHIVIPIFSSNFTGNPVVARGLISALMELEKAGYQADKRDWFAYATSYLNVFGGTHILDYYSEEEIRDKVLTYMWGLAGKQVPKAAAAPETEPKAETEATTRTELKAETEATPGSEPKTEPKAETEATPEIKAVKEISAMPEMAAVKKAAGFRAPTVEYRHDEPEEPMNTAEPEETQANAPAEDEAESGDIEGFHTEDYSSEDQMEISDIDWETPVIKGNDLTEDLEICGFQFIDNRETSGILWVIYDPENIELLDRISEVYRLKYRLEKRGAVATKNKAAWCITF